ncbi:MAG TPA: glycosyltransferase [Patescibacteria group bacterium]|nr:glycosyltransferase [Patescibacteria group bacterium]
MPQDIKKLKVALVYDRVNKWGGAERVVIALRKIFPDSILYTSVYKNDRASWAKKIPVVNSFLQKIPFASTHHESIAPLMPFAFESFNFDKFDLVISVTSEAGKGIITKPGTYHMSIILTPTRYLWSGYEEYFSNQTLKTIALPVVWYLRFWDKIAARRPDKLLGISETVRRRIKKYYDLDSDIVYPPLMLKPIRRGSKMNDKGLGNKKNLPAGEAGRQSSIVNRQSYFLVVSRLVPYKKVELAIGAANKLKAPLKVIGSGSEYAKLESMAGPTVEMIKYVSDQELKEYYANAKALIFPGEEDFGLVMVEANSLGIPVIAYRGGGAEEIVIEGKTGVFFDKQTVSSLVEVLKSFKPSRYNSSDCKRNARRFSFEQFEKKIRELVNESIHNT